MEWEKKNRWFFVMMQMMKKKVLYINYFESMMYHYSMQHLL